MYVGAVVGENSHFGSVSKSNIAWRRIVLAEQTSVNDTPGNCFISRCEADSDGTVRFTIICFRKNALIQNYL